MPNQEIFFHDDNSDGEELYHVRIIIEGRVQQVGLRHWIRRKAISLGINGWVRNRVNGTVEAMFGGKKQSVNEILKLCHHGPSFAHIKRIKEFPQTHQEKMPDDFSILPSI